MKLFPFETFYVYGISQCMDKSKYLSSSLSLTAIDMHQWTESVEILNSASYIATGL